MPQVQDSWLVEGGVFKISRLSIEERVYVAKHIRDGKLVVEDDPPPRNANPKGCFDALDVLSYFPDAHDHIEERLLASIPYENKKASRHKLYGFTDMTNIGVGPGVGQSHEECIFDVPLFEVGKPDEGVDWAAEFRAPKFNPNDAKKAKRSRTPKGDPVVSNSKKATASRKIPCPWCDVMYDGANAVHAMSTHVGKQHKEPGRREEWRKLAKEYRENPLKGVVEEGVATEG